MYSIRPDHHRWITVYGDDKCATAPLEDQVVYPGQPELGGYLVKEGTKTLWVTIHDPKVDPTWTGEH